MLFAAMMRKTPAERLLMGFDMSATARAMVWSTIPADLPEDERRRAFYLRDYGEPLPIPAQTGILRVAAQQSIQAMELPPIRKGHRMEYFPRG
jgi:hypothetical protein